MVEPGKCLSALSEGVIDATPRRASAQVSISLKHLSLEDLNRK